MTGLFDWIFKKVDLMTLAFAGAELPGHRLLAVVGLAGGFGRKILLEFESDQD